MKSSVILIAWMNADKKLLSCDRHLSLQLFQQVIYDNVHYQCITPFLIARLLAGKLGGKNVKIFQSPIR